MLVIIKEYLSLVKSKEVNHKKEYPSDIFYLFKKYYIS